MILSLMILSRLLRDGLPGIRLLTNLAMNKEIQLHDSEISRIAHSDGTTEIVFSIAYIHESAGVPGFNAGRIWHQGARVSIAGSMLLSSGGEPPIWALGGSLRIGLTSYEDFFPSGGQHEGDVELVINLSTDDGGDGGTLKVIGTGVKIELCGESSEPEACDGFPRRSA